MGRSTGIYRDEKTGLYWADKRYRGVRLRDNFKSHADAEEWLIRQLENLRRQKQFGDRPKVKFSDAAGRYLAEKVEKKMPSAVTSAFMLDAVMPFIGHMDIDKIHDGSLAAFKAARLAQKRKSKTINESISAVTTVLKRAAEVWLDDSGLTWLERAPKLSKICLNDARPPTPISWDEQANLMRNLPQHLVDMATLMLNTGARDDVVVNLQWEWEVKIPGTGASAFMVPEAHVKGEAEAKETKVLVLNSVAQEVLERMRGRHETYVFVWRRERTSAKKKHKTLPMKFEPVETMNNTAWQRARRVAGLGDLHVHDLRHTVGQRLRESGVLERTIGDILWHAGGTITSLYSAATFAELYKALELIKDSKGPRNPTLLSLQAEARSKKRARAPALNNSAA